MKTWKILTTAILALAAVALLVATASAQMMGGWGGYGGYGGGGIVGRWGEGMMGGNGGGMMGGYGYGYNNNPYGTAPNNQYYQPVYPFQFGGGCHGSFGGYGAAAPYVNSGAPLNVTTAKTIAQNYVASTNNPDLAVAEVEEYQANYYVRITEKSTGNGAFELLINKYTGSIYPEMGPNMMWNTKYGMMRGGILGGIFGTPTTTMTVTATQASANAQQFLTTNVPGTITGDVTTFYGYYTIEVLSGTTPYGMLSVNGYTGQVWFHNWHGAFIQEVELS